MQSFYSIIIPIYNELKQIPNLLTHTKQYFDLGHELIIIDDGSNDGSSELLSRADFIKFIKFDYNKGKGEALKKGLLNAINEKIIIFDGDLELHPKDIKKLMILNHQHKSYCVFANRINVNRSNSIWDIGNLLFTYLFNKKNKSNVKDALCCAKAFLKSDVDPKQLKANRFGIDVEISTYLVKKYASIKNIDIPYSRRSIQQGKKLRLINAFQILNRILNS